MNLATSQQEFMAQILFEDRPQPPAWPERMMQGLEVYRHAYRSRLVDALRETFPNTVKWVGDEAFLQAAAHHIIQHPPTSWTLDDAGKNFDITAQELFQNDPEVAELVWLEWSMHDIFTCADETALDLSAFIKLTDSFDDTDWDQVKIQFTGSMHLRSVQYDNVGLWRTMKNEKKTECAMPLSTYHGCLVWREGFVPACRLIDSAEMAFLQTIVEGAPYGDACRGLAEKMSESAAIEHAGQYLGHWLKDGLIVGLC